MHVKKTYISIIIVGLILAAIIFSGCTGSSNEVSGTGITPGATTDISSPENQQEETSGDQATAGDTILPGQKLSEPVRLPGSNTKQESAIPEYDPETKEKYLGEAKAEIIRVFPGADTSSLNNHHWDFNRAGSFFVPVIVFEGVIVDKNEPFNICEIGYDPQKERIVLWGYDNNAPRWDTGGGEIIRHEDVDIEDDIIPVFKLILGEEEYGKNRDNYFFKPVDSGNYPLTTITYVYESSKGIRFYMGKSQILFNRANGEIVAYRENFNDEDFYKQAMGLSPVPGISLEEAKSILEAKLDEAYPDDPQEVEYNPAKETSNSLLWLDADAYMDTENGYLLSPVPLAWEISYTTKGSRAETDRYLWAAIDANTGEIMSMGDPRIKIHGRSYD